MDLFFINRKRKIKYSNFTSVKCLTSTLDPSITPNPKPKSNLKHNHNPTPQASFLGVGLKGALAPGSTNRGSKKGGKGRKMSIEGVGEHVNLRPGAESEIVRTLGYEIRNKMTDEIKAGAK